MANGISHEFAPEVKHPTNAEGEIVSIVFDSIEGSVSVRINEVDLGVMVSGNEFTNGSWYPAVSLYYALDQVEIVK